MHFLKPHKGPVDESWANETSAKGPARKEETAMARPMKERTDPRAAAQVTEMALEPEAQEYYRRAMQALQRAEVPFLVGGAYAMAEYAGIIRHTKDFDVFVQRKDRDRALRALRAVCDRAEVLHQYWLAKAFQGEYFVDVIFNSGNGLEPVDESWFANAVPGTVLGLSVNLVPPVEIIAQKAFIQERERFDGADVAHLLRAQATKIDWQHLLDRFGEHWRVLFSHLLTFEYIYPSERNKIPRWVMDDLIGRWKKDSDQPPERAPLCRGTLLSRQQYLPDIQTWGYLDARRWPEPLMTERELAKWTDAIKVDGST